MELQEEPDSRVLPKVGFFLSRAEHSAALALDTETPLTDLTSKLYWKVGLEILTVNGFNPWEQ